jgi:hypothetical protein
LPFRSVTLGTFNHPWILTYLAQILATPAAMDTIREKSNHDIMDQNR